MFKISSTVFIMATCFAQTYQDDLSKLDERSRLIDSRIKALGFSKKPNDELLSGQDSDSSTEVKRYPLITMHGNHSSLRIKLGSLLNASLVTRLIVGPDGSSAILKLETNDSLNGVKLLGSAFQSSAEGRLIIQFNRLVFENGKFIPIKAQVMDESGAQGLKAQVFSSKALMLAGAMTSSFISGFAASSQSQTTNGFGFTQPQTTTRNAILGGVAETAADQSRRLIEEETKEKPILVVESKTKTLVYFDEEVRF